MIIGIIKNKDNSYEYIIKHKELICIHVDKLGFSYSNKEYISNIFNQIDNIDDEIEAILYNGNIKKNILRKIVIGSITIIIGFNFSNFIDDLKSKNFNNVNIEQPIIETEVIDYKKAIDLINSSSIDDTFKKCIINEDFFKDVFSNYYKTPMQYIINVNLANLKINFVDMNDDTMGYYDPLNSNIIYVSSKYENDLEKVKRIVIHEFIHLLQSSTSKYNYILEAIDELIMKEYYGKEVISYQEGVKNLMLLIDIIGPKYVMNLAFAGNDNEFETILKDNLNNEDYLKLIKYFKNSSFSIGHNQINKKIRLILCELYQNMYGQNINKDENILYDIVYKDNNINCNAVSKYYLNERKMTDYIIYNGKEISIESIKNRFKDNRIYKK